MRKYFSVYAPRVLMVLLFASLLSSCARFSGFAGTSKTSGLSFDEVVVYNSSDWMIHDVKIRVPATNKVFFCGVIVEHTECSNRFHQRIYEGHSVSISWNDRFADYQIGPVELEVPEKPDADAIFAVVLVLGPTGGYRLGFREKSRPEPY